MIPKPPSTGTELADAATLRTLLASRRPNPDAFAAGVAARLANAAAATETPAAKPAAESPQWALRSIMDRAATLLPGLPTGSALGTSWTVIAALPIVVVVGTLGAFLYALSRVDPARHHDASATTPAEREALSKWFAQVPSLFALLPLAILFVAIVCGREWILDLATLSLTGAMLALAWQVTIAARDVTVDADRLCATTVLLLLAMLFGTEAWLDSLAVDTGASRLVDSAPCWILFAGLVACLATFVATSRRPMAWKLSLALLPVALFATTFDLPRDLRAELRRDWAALSLKSEASAHWDTAATMARVSRELGLEAPAMPNVRRRLDEVLADPKIADKVHPSVWTGALEIGLLTADDLRRIASLPSTSSFLQDLPDTVVRLRVPNGGEYLLDCLLATRRLDDQERQRLIRSIDQAWPQIDATNDPLATTALCVRWLRRLSAEDRLAQRRDDIHATVLRHRVNPQENAWPSQLGGFSRRAGRDRSDDDANANAVELIAAVGAPPGLTVDALHGYLRAEVCTPLITDLLGRTPRTSTASLMLLRERIGLPPRTWLRAVVDERALLAAFLLVLLSLYSIWTAQRRAVRSIGAQP